jgi:glucose-6-phosphate isomerase
MLDTGLLLLSLIVMRTQPSAHLPCACLQALSKLAPHIQQVSMESNGKGVDIHGRPLPFDAGQSVSIRV